jgi:hypothetical protein
MFLHVTRSATRSVPDVPIIVERFSRAMRERLTTGEVPFRKAYVGSLIDRVEVDDREVRIVRRKDVLWSWPADRTSLALPVAQINSGVTSFLPSLAGESGTGPWEPVRKRPLSGRPGVRIEIWWGSRRPSTC